MAAPLSRYLTRRRYDGPQSVRASAATDDRVSVFEYRTERISVDPHPKDNVIDLYSPAVAVAAKTKKKYERKQTQEEKQSQIQ